MKMDLKISITQLENSRESLTHRMNQVEGRISGLKYKLEDLDKINKGYQ